MMWNQLKKYMKYLKISVQGDSFGNMIYPDKYEEEIAKFNSGSLYFEDGIYLKLLLCIPDKDFKSSMIRTNVEEITELQAKSISEAKEVRTETIKDEVKLRRIELKVAMGQQLTVEEEDSIDITKPNSIFETKKILADRIDIIKADEINEAKIL